MNAHASVSVSVCQTYRYEREAITEQWTQHDQTETADSAD